LELVCGREFLDIETIRQNTIRLALEQVLTLVGGNVRDGGKDIGGVRSSTLNTVSMVDTTLASFGVYIKPLQIVVEIYISGAEISSKESSVGREDRSHVNAPALAKRKGDTC